MARFGISAIPKRISKLLVKGMLGTKWLVTGFY